MPQAGILKSSDEVVTLILWDKPVILLKARFSDIDRLSI